MKKLFFIKSISIFNRKLSEGKISPESIVFIEEDGSIWTHGVFFGKGSLSSTKYAYGEWDFRQEAIREREEQERLENENNDNENGENW